eukprot:CAMPEP_0194200522 /NCGR_PEP_ID=MMETSP0156-20130528/1090_1 /TAXON_ID=33649 /ORGANISM="Thalassionema nitzschioides, Strain L26-B" /LENGTH=235 /DNA_ID=CAMNT_0038925529 /DNA_START=90 /DNA_END=797 /DNA_ORIENTATION=-
MASEGAFARLTNQILETADKAANVIDEGLSIMMTGKIKEDGAPTEEPLTGDLPDDDILTEMDEDMMGSPLEGIADGVLKDIMSSNIGPQTPMEHLSAFSSAITWSEPFILYLIAFQVFMFFLCLWVSRKGFAMVPRLVLMSFVAIIVRCAEILNGYGARNWESIATQNYFDRSGIFIGIFFCGPLLLDCFIVLTLLIREASQLLVEVKKMELKKKRDSKEKKGGGKKSKNPKKDN